MPLLIRNSAETFCTWKNKASEFAKIIPTKHLMMTMKHNSKASDFLLKRASTHQRLNARSLIYSQVSDRNATLLWRGGGVIVFVR